MPFPRTSLLISALLTGGLALPANAELRYENATGGAALFYGQFNPAYLRFDDGVSTTGRIVDNSHSNSRVGVWIRQPFGTSEFGFNFETALGFRQSSLTDQVFTPDPLNWQRTSIRKVDFVWKTATAGTFYFGQGSEASDGTADIDLSGTTLVNYNLVGDTAGAVLFRTTAGALSARQIAAVFPSFDGGRRGRVRYDTPSFGGFSLSASHGEEILAQTVDLTSSSVALRYAGEAGGFRILGAVGYTRQESGTGVTRHDTAGSISLLHGSGFNVTLAAGDRKESGHYGYGKLGYQANWFAVGKTALAVDYYGGNDMVVAGSQSDTVGIGAVQSFDAANVDAYVGYREYSLAEPAASYRDVSTVLFGARWKF